MEWAFAGVLSGLVLISFVWILQLKVSLNELKSQINIRSDKYVKDYEFQFHKDNQMLTNNFEDKRLQRLEIFLQTKHPEFKDMR